MTTTTTTSNQYFYQNQQDQYTFYRIPKALIKGVRYQHVTMEAKLLYGILLDRMSLSGKNDWCDAGGKDIHYLYRGRTDGGFWLLQ